MISMLSEVPVPIPDRVAVLIGSQIPEYVMQAEIDAENAAYIARLCRSPFNREAREVALSELARANKVLATYSPKLVLTPGGAR